MNKKFYIIPGWRENARRRQYQNLGKAVRNLGYDVVFKNVDWDNKISKQTFAIEDDSILFGFSIGAMLARLIVQDYKCKLVIFASMTPLRHFKGGEREKLLADVIGSKFVMDVKKNLKPKIKAKSILMYGDKEDEKADIIVPDTDHEISKNYVKEVIKIIEKLD